MMNCEEQENSEDKWDDVLLIELKRRMEIGDNRIEEEMLLKERPSIKCVCLQKNLQGDGDLKSISEIKTTTNNVGSSKGLRLDARPSIVCVRLRD